MLQELARLFETRVGVNLDQPRCANFIKHKVITVNFKAKLALIFVDFLADCSQRQPNNRYTFLFDDALDVNAANFLQSVDVPEK